MKIQQIYHPYYLWEDYKCGFYDNISGVNKDNLTKQVVLFFENDNLVQEYMQKVIKQWVNSCEHNLSNLSMNRIAYLGQAASCIYCAAPSLITMNAWSYVNQVSQNKANEIAQTIINKWEVEFIKNKQLCLKLN
jgi:hypothetical protein